MSKAPPTTSTSLGPRILIGLAALVTLFFVRALHPGTIFVNPDPQGGIAVFLTPIYQGIAMIIPFPLLRSALRKYRHHLRHRLR